MLGINYAILIFYENIVEGYISLINNSAYLNEF